MFTSAPEVHYTTVVSALSQRCSWQLALRVVRSLPPGVFANAFTFNSLASACTGGRQWALALHIQEDMRNNGVLADDVTQNVMLGACEKGSQWRMALQITGTEGSQATISFNSLLATLQAIQSWKWALLGFNMMVPYRARPDCISCSTCISCCQHDWHLAMNCFAELKFAALQPNDVIYGAFLNSCEKTSSWLLALQVSRGMPATSLVPNNYIFNSVISALDKSSKWMDAAELFSRMPQHAVDTITCTALISAYGKASRWTCSLALLHRMPEFSVIPNAATFNAALTSCSSHGLATALMAWNQLKTLDQPSFPDVLTYNIMINACSKEGWAFWDLRYV